MRGKRLALVALSLAVGLSASPLVSTDEGTRTSAAGFRTPQELLIDHYLEEAVKEEKAPEDAYLYSKIFSGDPPTPEVFRAATRQARRVGRETAASKPRLAGERWRYIGPNNIGARVVDVTADPERKGVVFTAAATGGVWKSTDSGMTYKSVWPKHKTQSMGALAQGKDGTLWLGTGETNPGGGSLTYGGTGVYKSTNRGKSWKKVGLGATARIGRIAVNPKDPRHVLVAATGSLFAPGGSRGLYETRNGGKTWDLILKPENKTTGAVDVAIDPKNPKNIFVTMWDHIRRPDVRRYTGPGSGIWRSTDGGKTFEELSVANGLPEGNEATGGRIGIAIDPKNPDRLWAIYANNLEGSFAAFYVSHNGGDTWFAPPTAQATLAASQSVYGWWFGRIFVDPVDTDRVFVTGLTLSQSNDGGLSFPFQHTQQHVDHHGMAWDPFKKNRVYNGNDGGIYRSDENGNPGTWTHARKMPFNQFFTIDVSEQDPSWINGGLQDQSSVRSWKGRGRGGWDQYNGGDGVKNAINPRDKRNIFSCSQYGNCSRSEDGGDTLRDMAQESTRYGWLTPIEFQPGDNQGRVMYWAGDSVHRSEDRGKTWKRISPDLGEGDPGRETNPLYAAHYGTVQAIGLNKKNPQVIYAGTDNAKLWKTTNRGASWHKIVDDKLPDRWITHIAVENDNPNVVYVTYSGYREGYRAPYVLRSRSGGKHWEDVSFNLPRAPVNDIILVGKKVYVATDVGVFVKSRGATKWHKLGRGLPLSPINDIRYIRKNNTLYAGSFGRGIWTISPPK
ncbi:MAG: glycosyl hydrolase [Actinomycetota bacterium]|nr:glycosyl hydrolase [Actinomycetota bacterium]